MEQLKQLEIKQKYTLVKMGDMGFCFKVQFELIEIKNEPWAQYPESVLLIFKEKRKRNLRAIRFLPRDNFLVYSGFVDANTEIGISTSQGDGYTVTKSLMSCDVEYLFRAKRSVEQTPIIEKITQDSINYSKKCGEMMK